VDLNESLADLEYLAKQSSIKVADISKIKNNLKSEKLKNYLDLLLKSKPETLVSEYVIDPVLHEIGITANPQTSVRKGQTTDWVDYEISTRTHNPVGLEVKPMFTLSYSKKNIEILSLQSRFDKLKKEFIRGKTNQIINYLGKYAYIIFTNGVDVMFFNRDAIADFKPFYETTFIKFVRELAISKDLYEFAQEQEDTVISGKRNILDAEFFKDLEEWYKYLRKIKWRGDSDLVEKAKIALLDKLIFAQTLEDYSLVPFKFLVKEFNDVENKWYPKGEKIALEEFFKVIDKWFYEYYDTELFRTNVLDYIDDMPQNYKDFYNLLKWIIGLGVWEQTFRKGIASYNYRYIDEDIFGKAYETFLAENRKEEGIYYTPKVATNFMSHSLVEAVCKEEKNKLIALFKKQMDNSDFEEAKRLASSLTSKAFIDISMGSGSFLIKVLREIFKVYMDIDKATNWAVKGGNIGEPDDITKRREKVLEIRRIMGFYGGQALTVKRKLITLIVLRHIYGIDLDYGALEVGKANLWKEAVKLLPGEFRFEKLNGKNDHVLPNLLANLIQGNSLTSLPDKQIIKKIEKNKGLQEKIMKIIQLRNEYLENPSDPKPIDKIVEVKKEVRDAFADKVSKEAALYPVEFPHLYFDKDGDLLPAEKRGFSGVIGNPPYVQLQKLKDNPIHKEYENQGYETYDATGDIYCLFYERGLSLLGNGGYLCYITSNKWMRAKYGKKLGEYFAKFNPKMIIDLGPNVFKDATVDTSVLLIQKVANRDELRGISLTGESVDDLSRYFEENAIKLPDFKGNPWFIGNKAEQNLKKKIEKIGMPLKDWDVNIYRGILTGYNDAFIITTEKRNEILANCKTEEERKRTEETIKLILKGRDIGRYYYKWADKWLIFIPWHFPLNYDKLIQGASKEAENEFKKQYPAIYNHLLQYKEKLSNRNKSETGIRYEWYALQRCAATYYPEFEKEKIIFSRIIKSPQFAYDNKKMYCEDTTYSLTGGHIEYLLAFLNSAAVYNIFYLFYSGGGIDGEIKIYKLNLLPIPPITNKNSAVASQVVDLANQILAITQKPDYDPQANTEDNKRVKELEHQIDQLVYKLYDLTDEEIKIVERDK